MRELLKISFSMGLTLCCAMTGGFANAAYITALNAIAGADRISYWDLNEVSGTTASDAWTAGTLDGNNPGTYVGTGITVGAVGPRPADGFLGFSDSNGATNFAGTSTAQILKMANSASFNSVESLTMVMWFNIPTGTSGQRHFGGLADSTTAAGGRYGFSIHGNTVPRAYIRLQNGANPVEADELNGNSGNPSPTYRDSAWHMLAMTMEDSGTSKGFKVYIDGNERTDLAGLIANGAGKHIADRHTIVANSVLAFANDLGDTSRRFIGRLDEIAFIGRSLSTDEVSRLYNAAVVPEPGSIVLLGLGGVFGLIAMRKRFAKSK